MQEEFKITDSFGKEKVIIETDLTYTTLEQLIEIESMQKNNNFKMRDAKLFDILPRELTIALLLNCRYRYENNIKQTDLQACLKHEVGDLGNMYIANLLFRIKSSMKKPMKEPFKYLADLTIDGIIKNNDIELSNELHINNKTKLLN